MADEIRACADLEERLTPYVDGEDTSSAHQAVAAHLSGCGSCTDKARDEATARQIVHERRETLAAHAPATLRARCAAFAASNSPGAKSTFQVPNPSARPGASLLRRWAPLSLAATLVLAVAGVFAFGLNDRVQALAASLAVDHVKCFKVNGTDGDADAHASARSWEMQQGWPIVVPQTEAAQQIKLLGVRLCLSSDGRVAHLMYTWRGEPLSLYVLQEDAGREGTIRKMGAQEVIWRANQRTYALVSGDTTRDLSTVVEYMKARVR